MFHNRNPCSYSFSSTLFIVLNHDGGVGGYCNPHSDPKTNRSAPVKRDQSRPISNGANDDERETLFRFVGLFAAISTTTRGRKRGGPSSGVAHPMDCGGNRRSEWIPAAKDLRWIAFVGADCWASGVRQSRVCALKTRIAAVADDSHSFLLIGLFVWFF